MGIIQKLFSSKSNAVTDFEKLRFNLNKDKEDPRDYLVKAAITTDETPESVDWSFLFTEIKQQGVIGSCGSHAITSCYEGLIKKYHPEWVMPGSERFHYYNVRVLMGTYPTDSGQSLREGIKALKGDGFCPETLCRYSTVDYNKKPGIFAYSFANIYNKKFPVKEYNRCFSVDDMIISLAQGLPVILGVLVYADFIKLGDGIYTIPTGKYLGGHAMLIVGYNKKESSFTLLNSWGESWGVKGFGKVSFDYVRKSLIDAWTMQV
jgi:C1A family cysteine protease